KDYAFMNTNGGYYEFHEFEAEGTLTGIDFHTYFETSGPSTWAGDLALLFIDPNGNQLQYGGYNIDWEGVESAGDFDSSWDDAMATDYHASFSLEGFEASLSGSGTWQWALLNGYTNSVNTSWESNDQGGITFIGLNEIPSPGAAGLLGIAGLLCRRHRRRA
ncbi:MAG: hypothetical protein MK085_10585, partial [Phycisphaerales bacterium]|nr:hypothetical protein [Phycisphaerales bacterium]